MAAIGDPRQFKRYVVRMQGGHAAAALQAAYDAGCWAAYARRPVRNPYPAGKRHDTFEYGRRSSDPMGDWHGGNA